jgi:hypothetical protein
MLLRLIVIECFKHLFNGKPKYCLRKCANDLRKVRESNYMNLHPTCLSN